MVECPCCLEDLRTIVDKGKGYANLTCSHLMCETCFVNHTESNGIPSNNNLLINCPLCRHQTEIKLDLGDGFVGKNKHQYKIDGGLVYQARTLPHKNQIFAFLGIKYIPISCMPLTQLYHKNGCAECNIKGIAVFPYQCYNSDYDFNDRNNNEIAYLCPKCVLPKSLSSYANSLPHLIKHLESKFKIDEIKLSESDLLNRFYNKSYHEIKLIIDNLYFIASPKQNQVISLRLFVRFEKIIRLTINAKYGTEHNESYELIYYLSEKFTPFMVQYYNKHETPILHKQLHTLQFDNAIFLMYLTRNSLLGIQGWGYDEKLGHLNQFINMQTKPDFLMSQCSQPKEVSIDIIDDLIDNDLREIDKKLKELQELKKLTLKRKKLF